LSVTGADVAAGVELSDDEDDEDDDESLLLEPQAVTPIATTPAAAIACRERILISSLLGIVQRPRGSRVQNAILLSNRSRNMRTR